MLSFDELFECLVLLIACRMSGKFSWQTAVLHWPFLRPMIAWLELTIADVHEYAQMMNRSIFQLAVDFIFHFDTLTLSKKR